MSTDIGYSPVKIRINYKKWINEICVNILPITYIKYIFFKRTIVNSIEINSEFSIS